MRESADGTHVIFEQAGGRIIHNGMFNLIGFFFSFLIGLWMVPYMLGHLGSTAYGTWAILVALVSWLPLADFGVASSLSRFVAEFRSRKEMDRLAEVVSSALVLFLVLAVGIACIMALCSHLLVRFFVPTSNPAVGDLSGLLIVLSGISALGLLGSAYASILEGIQRMDVTNTIRVVALVTLAGAVFVGLELRLGLWAVVFAQAISTLATVGFSALAAHRLVPEVPIWPRRISTVHFRELLSFSAGVFVIQLATTVHRQLDKLILGRFGLISAAGMYDVAAEQAHRAGIIPRLVLAPLLPASAELSTAGVPDARARLFARSLRYIALIASPLAAVAFTLGPPFVDLWLGQDYAPVGHALPILVAAGLVNVLTGPGVLIEMGYGQVRPSALAAGFALTSNIILSLLLVQPHGFMGVVIATGLTTALWGGLLLVYHCWSAGLSFGSVVRSILAPTALGFVSAAMVRLLHTPTDWMALMVDLLGVGILYVISVFTCRLIKADEFRMAVNAVLFLPVTDQL